MLRAENFSYLGDLVKAEASYAAAIKSARSSGFIHEQGLACELAGYHYEENVGDIGCARGFFDQAIDCYLQWGSKMKVDSITCHINSTSFVTTTRAAIELFAQRHILTVLSQRDEGGSLPSSLQVD